MKKSGHVILIFCFLSMSPLAMSNTDSLLNAMDHSPVLKDRLHAGVLIAQQLMRTNRDSSFKLLQRAAPLAHTRGGKVGLSDLIRQVDYYNTWGSYYWHEGCSESAIDYYRLVTELPQLEKIKPSISLAANNIGTLYSRLGLSDSARKYLHLALDIDTQLGYKRGMTKTMYDLGRFHFRQDQHELALKYLLKAADYQTLEKDTFRLIHSLTLLGNVYRQIDSIPKAVEYHYKSLILSIALNEPKRIVTAYNNLTSVFCGQPGNLEKTIHYAVKGLRIASELDFYNDLLTLNSNIGTAYLINGEPHKALDYFNEAYDYRHKATRVASICALYVNLGEIHMTLGDYVAAVQYLQKAVEIAQNIHSLRLQSRALLFLSEIDHQLGNADGELENYKQGIAIRDSIWNREHKSRIAELQIIHETEKKTHQIIELTRKEEVNRLRWHLGVVSGLIITLAFISTILFLFKQRKIISQQLIIHRQELEKTQIALNANKQELTGKAFSLSKSNEIINQLKMEVRQMISGRAANNPDELRKVLRLLDSNDKNQYLWKEFENRFNELNDGFISKLVSIHPDLTPAEIRMCAMLRLQLTSKEISDITNRSTRTIETIRSNIRKKMKLESSSNLTTYLLQI